MCLYRVEYLPWLALNLHTILYIYDCERSFWLFCEVLGADVPVLDLGAGSKMEINPKLKVNQKSSDLSAHLFDSWVQKNNSNNRQGLKIAAALVKVITKKTTTGQN